MGWEHAVLGALVVALAVACSVLACAVVSLRREMRRMAAWLRECDLAANERLTLASHARPAVELARAVNGLLDAERARRLDEERARRAFQADLAALSHDIRTPLAGAQGYLELQGMTSDPAQRERYALAAQERLATMRDLVDDLLDYTRLASTREDAPSAPVNVSALLEDALAAAYPAFEERGWELQVECDDDNLVACVDGKGLRRAFANLVANMLRHGAGTPTVTVEAGGSVVFSNAVARPEEIDVSRLFERFYRADAARGGGGSGLGLAIVAELCQRMGVGVAAQVEDGVFAIELDFSQVRAAGSGIG